MQKITAGLLTAQVYKTFLCSLSFQAVETSYNMLKERGLIQPVPNGEVSFFSSSQGLFHIFVSLVDMYF